MAQVAFNFAEMKNATIMQNAIVLPRRDSGLSRRIRSFRNLRENIPFYILGLIATIWPLGMFLLSMRKICYCTQTFYSQYGMYTKMELIPEMVIVLAFVTALVIFAQIILIIGIRKRINTDITSKMN